MRTIEEIQLIRRKEGIQLGNMQISFILSKIRPESKVLVFGAGNDSQLWCENNISGRTVVLENLRQWFEKTKSKKINIDLFLIKYKSKVAYWRKYLKNEKSLYLSLPQQVFDNKWDIVIVDGPMGLMKDSPGRMKSIFMASKLVRKGGWVFVHDTNRKIEYIYSRIFLGRKNLALEIKGPTGEMSCFKMDNKVSNLSSKIRKILSPLYYLVL